MHKDRLPDVDAFLEELTALCRKHKMELWAPEKYGGMQLLISHKISDYEYAVCANLTDPTDIRILNVHTTCWDVSSC